VLYNGNLALEKGIIDLKSQYNDNFWAILPVERMQISQEQMIAGQTKNQNFEKAETKAVKAIQKHSMNVDGSEKNPQIDEAHLLLGKTRYYDQRFVPALEAFNYVLYKYPTSSRIQEVKIWREKTNMRMDNDATAVVNLKKLLGEIKFKDQIYADANATLAQAYINLDEDKNALARLKIATEFTKSKEEKARYRFIEAQIYERLGHKDSAYAKFQEVIDMKRKSARQYVIQAHAHQAAQFDFTTVVTSVSTTSMTFQVRGPFASVGTHTFICFAAYA
jgi:tetratricopeptide (TPR) repeat protein